MSSSVRGTHTHALGHSESAEESYSESLNIQRPHNIRTLAFGKCTISDKQTALNIC